LFDKELIKQSQNHKVSPPYAMVRKTSLLSLTFNGLKCNAMTNMKHRLLIFSLCQNLSGPPVFGADHALKSGRVLTEGQGGNWRLRLQTTECTSTTAKSEGKTL